MRRHIQHTVATTALCILLCDCENTTFTSSIPTMPVHYEINILGEKNYFVVDNGFQTMVIKERRYHTDAIGYAGLVVWVDYNSTYKAADLCCPKCLNKQYPVEVDGIFAICPICGELYDLSNGYATPTKGISNEALRKYQAIYDPSKGRLLITQ